MRNRLLILVVTIVTAATLISHLAGRDTDQLAAAPEVNYRAGSFELTDLNDRLIRLEEFRGQPVVLNFWASWCLPCRTETPDLVALHEKYSGRVSFIGVNVTHKDALDDVQRFVGDYSITYPVALDRSGAVSKQYRIAAMPTSFVLNGDGVIVYKKIGVVSRRELERVLEPLLSQGSAETKLSTGRL
ncbi:MAG: TlpA family protein disulfide reductase [Brevibacillus sp.]|nr:TlpA family protein disulfide reductase [Brevibacillus sp.]